MYIEIELNSTEICYTLTTIGATIAAFQILTQSFTIIRIDCKIGLLDPYIELITGNFIFSE